MISDRNELQQMDEASLRQVVIIPLMEKMGYGAVFEWHGGPGELGKDVVGWKANQLGNRRNTAVVAKVSRMSANNQLMDVATQVSQAFNTSFKDPSTGEDQRVHEVWIVTNKKLGKEARERLRAAVPSAFGPYIDVLDGNDLWRLMKKYFPIELHQLLDEAQHLLQRMRSPYSVTVHLSTESRGRTFTLEERQPWQPSGAAVSIQSVFKFPNTPEGRAKFEEFRSAMETGTEVELPGQYVNLQLPHDLDSVLTELLGAPPSQLQNLSISSAVSSHRSPVRIDIVCDDGDAASLDYVELAVVRAGTKQITLSNASQPIPIGVNMVVDFGKDDERMISTITVTKKQVDAIAAPVLHDLLRMLRCMGKPCEVRITSLEERLVIALARSAGSGGRGIPDQFVAMVGDLAAIQARVKTPIHIPNRELTRDELETIATLRTILHEGEINGGHDASLRMSVSVPHLQKVLDAIVIGPRTSLRLEPREVQAVELFGTEITLGKVAYILEGITLANEQEVRSRLASNTATDEEVELRLVATESGRLVCHYLDWETGRIALTPGS
jgi:hypothetical protein